MGATSWAIPVGVLAALCSAMFIFIWWWFPRHYRKGVQADMDRVDEERREREAYQASNTVELAVDENGQPVEGSVAKPKPTTFAYHPPAYTSY
ncbi:hypothetical protein LTR85_002109 [Meristemomyces frigidus]|nr:hypothetical protein LTR85_002109 [Meristemomyces frigidus]